MARYKIQAIEKRVLKTYVTANSIEEATEIFNDSTDCEFEEIDGSLEIYHYDTIKTDEKPSFIIKDFGNDFECYSVEELNNLLFESFNNRSIAVHDKRDALTKVFFIDVKDGILYDSYIENKKHLFF